MNYSYEGQKVTLSIINDILEKNKFKKKCPMGFGLFLGCIRQGKLNTSINDWDDLDFNVLSSDWDELTATIIPRLIECGFECLHSFVNTAGDISEITLRHGKDRVDFHKNYELSSGYLHFCWHGGYELGKIMKSKYFLDVKEYSIEEHLFYGPSDSEEYLIDLYGKNWATPCKTEDEYKYWEDFPGIPWSFKRRGEKIIKGEYNVK